MSYIHTPTGRYPLSAKHIRSENPDTSFPVIFEPPADYKMVLSTDRPAHDVNTQGVREASPSCVNGEWYQVWEVYALDASTLAANESNKGRAVRANRNRLLAECDWTQVADAPVNQPAWAQYRQALRDISSQPGFPYSVEWPQAPQ